MAELFGHVADAMFSMCSTAAGTKPPRAGIENVSTACRSTAVRVAKSLTVVG
jgi:hypothetical protein